MPKPKNVVLVGVNPDFAVKLRRVLSSDCQIKNFTGQIDFGVNIFYVVETEVIGWQTWLLRLIHAGEKVVVVFANTSPGWEKAIMAVDGVVLRPIDNDAIIRSALLRSKFIA